MSKNLPVKRQHMIPNPYVRYTVAGVLGLVTAALVWASRLAFSKGS